MTSSLLSRIARPASRLTGRGRVWIKLGTGFMPFADAASAELPLGRLLRLSLFQVSVGIAVTLLIGTLNRVMIVELAVPAWLVAVMVSLPLFVAPFRAVIGFKSDVHKSVLGWRRVPYLWTGALLQFGGLAIMPFALIDLSGDMNGPLWIGKAGAAFAFLLVGAGLHTVQTAGLGPGHRFVAATAFAARRGAAVRGDVAWHRRQRAYFWHRAEAFLGNPPYPGGAGRGLGEFDPQHGGAVETGSAGPYACRARG